MAKLIPLDDGRLKLLQEILSSISLIGESIFKSPAVPRIFCALDIFCPAPTEVCTVIFDSFSFVACFRPGYGNENFEVRPIVYSLASVVSQGTLPAPSVGSKSDTGWELESALLIILFP